MNERDKEELYIQAIQALKPELRQLLGPEEGTRLSRSLGQYLRRARSPEYRERAVTRALDRIARHPPARERLGHILAEMGDPDAAARLYAALPGGPSPIPAGTVVVCPVDPSHLRRVVQFAGQRFRCPQHQRDLVPESEARASSTATGQAATSAQHQVDLAPESEVRSDG